MTSSDPWDSPEMQQWMESVREGMIPKVKDSAMTGAIISGAEPDIKQAVEIGYTLLLGKPLVLLVTPGTQVQPGLAKAADRIVEFDHRDPTFPERLQAVLNELDAEGRLG